MTVGEYSGIVDEPQVGVTPKKRKAAIRRAIRQIDAGIRQLGNVRAALADALDEPLPVPQSFHIANNLFLANLGLGEIDTSTLPFILSDGHSDDKTELRIGFEERCRKVGFRNESDALIWFQAYCLGLEMAKDKLPEPTKLEMWFQGLEG